MCPPHRPPPLPLAIGLWGKMDLVELPQESHTRKKERLTLVSVRGGMVSWKEILQGSDNLPHHLVEKLPLRQ